MNVQIGKSVGKRMRGRVGQKVEQKKAMEIYEHPSFSRATYSRRRDSRQGQRLLQ